MHKSTEIVLRCRILEALPEEVWKRFDAEEGGKASFERDAEPMTSALDAGELEYAPTSDDGRPRA